MNLLFTPINIYMNSLRFWFVPEKSQCRPKFFNCFFLAIGFNFCWFNWNTYNLINYLIDIMRRNKYWCTSWNANMSKCEFHKSKIVKK